MSDPACKDCKYYHQGMLPKDSGYGDCTDPSKRIYSKHGASLSEAPEVYYANTCSNWTWKEKENGNSTP